MNYDFDRIIDRRNTSCVKWDARLDLFGTDDVLPMWVADMDFPCPRPVLEALRRRLDHPILGYGLPPDSLYQAIIDRMARRYGWAVEKDWITFTPGVVTATYAAVRTLAVPGDEIILQPPVYYPFFSVVTNSGCQVVPNQLCLVGDRYEMDFEDLERRLGAPGDHGGKTHRIRGLILCSPHNPVGRVWTAAELRRLGDICRSHECVVVADEIHGDLLIDGAEHTPLAGLSEELAQNTITLMAPSKTFNLAGMAASFAIIPSPRLRRDFERARLGQGGVNVLGLVAMEAALRDGDSYLEELNRYLSGNVRYFSEAVAAIPGLRLIRPEGTYLAWVDARGLGLDDEALRDFMLRKARVASDFGHVFGPGGSGFLRVNLGCPRSLVAEAVARLKAAVAELKAAGALPEAAAGLKAAGALPAGATRESRGE